MKPNLLKTSSLIVLGKITALEGSVEKVLVHTIW